MSYATQVASYREMEILSASPERLVVLLFDHLAIHLQRVRIAIDNNDVNLRTLSLGKARGIVSELLATLNFEKGGKIARDLGSLYTFLLAEMSEIGVHRDARKVDRLMQIAETLRAGFAGAATMAVPAKRPA
ncbi:MAG: flagellar export chaperone FliS [Gemmatimonadaceae bacterium]